MQKTSYFSKTIRTCAIIAAALRSQFTLVSTPQAKCDSSPVKVISRNTTPTSNDVFYYSEKKTEDFEI